MMWIVDDVWVVVSMDYHYHYQYRVYDDVYYLDVVGVVYVDFRCFYDSVHLYRYQSIYYRFFVVVFVWVMAVVYAYHYDVSVHPYQLFANHHDYHLVLIVMYVD